LFEGQSDARGVGGTSSPSSSPKNMRAQTPLRPHSLPCFFFPGRGLRERDRERIFQFDAAGEDEESDDDEAESEFSSLLSPSGTQHKRSLALTSRARALERVRVSVSFALRQRNNISVAVFSRFSLSLLSSTTNHPSHHKGRKRRPFFCTSSFPSPVHLGK